MCGVVMHALPASIALGWLCPKLGAGSAQRGTAAGGGGHGEVLTSHRQGKGILMGRGEFNLLPVNNKAGQRELKANKKHAQTMFPLLPLA